MKSTELISDLLSLGKDSSEAADEDKHLINAFIDNQDRLRTRIYGSNRKGEELVGNMVRTQSHTGTIL